MGGESIGMSAAEAAGALRWWLEAGVDVAVQEEPRDWLKREGASADPELPMPTTSPSPTPPDEPPESFDLFRQWLESGTALPMAGPGARRVLPRGIEQAPVMLLAEAPGNDEAAAGQPIGGEAWELTMRMLAAIGIEAEAAYLANISCFHAPGARMSPQDFDACATIARRHVALAKPQRLLLLGEGPTRALLGKTVAAARGHVHKVEGVRTIATFHPRFLLNRPADKSLAWKDLLLLMED